MGTPLGPKYIPYTYMDPLGKTMQMAPATLIVPKGSAQASPLSQRVQVPNNHILTPNLYYNYYHPNPKYLIIGYMDPQGFKYFIQTSSPGATPLLKSSELSLCKYQFKVFASLKAAGCMKDLHLLSARVFSGFLFRALHRPCSITTMVQVGK